MHPPPGHPKPAPADDHFLPKIHPSAVRCRHARDREPWRSREAAMDLTGGGDGSEGMAVAPCTVNYRTDPCRSLNATETV